MEQERDPMALWVGFWQPDEAADRDRRPVRRRARTEEDSDWLASDPDR